MRNGGASEIFTVCTFGQTIVVRVAQIANHGDYCSCIFPWPGAMVPILDAISYFWFSCYHLDWIA
jgi:hypothetical protein